jgi:tRNA-intron endonuclease
MEGRREDGSIVVGGDARQRFYDARGYGRPLAGNDIALAPVEAAHLLFRGDLDAVDGRDFRAFFAHHRGDGFAARFLVYADLRDRGFYLSPAREGWVPGDGTSGDQAPPSDLLVYPRGKGPSDGAVRYHVRVVGERESVPAADLGRVVLAVVDEESEITYFETDRPDLSGSSDFEPTSEVPGDLLADRVVVWDPPADLHRRGFFGQPLSGRDGGDDLRALQLSLVEAAHLAREGMLTVEGGPEAILERGRAVEGERFDCRLETYAALRRADVVPKTGFKFGADFRTYADVTSVDDLGHSEFLVRVLPAGHVFDPRDLALDVRLAHGVRKRMVFALVGDGNDDGIEWLSVGRLTP